MRGMESRSYRSEDMSEIAEALKRVKHTYVEMEGRLINFGFPVCLFGERERFRGRWVKERK